MRALKSGDLVEAAVWLAPAGWLYYRSFEFDREIEIYRYGAAAWPRAVLLLIAVAALGQLIWRMRGGGNGNGGESESVTLDGMRIYAAAAMLLTLPLAYALFPQWAHAHFAPQGFGLHALKISTAAVLLTLYAFGMRAHPAAAMLALPVFFGVLLTDFGFYLLAPLFAAAVMVLMGERRAHCIAGVTALITAVLFFLFVSLLYVGLPPGNISPFYEISAALVTLLQ